MELAYSILDTNSLTAVTMAVLPKKSTLRNATSLTLIMVESQSQVAVIVGGLLIRRSPESGAAVIPGQ